ncbi:ubiquitin carboxyl-terminal hydrolase isozyme l3 [Nannochloropsis gaditana]|uniref:Ubiquitin carboxyl-terminal hydrolase n=2 Tax=Nannochloropsis gaditana TaxID=72520 RepID=W7TUN0_9STRA|nr:ubiquitin carboxyl-terminal hydrolase isozyme l3 [Nannochloropsis gaditana]
MTSTLSPVWQHLVSRKGVLDLHVLRCLQKTGHLHHIRMHGSCFLNKIFQIYLIMQLSLLYFIHWQVATAIMVPDKPVSPPPPPPPSRETTASEAAKPGKRAKRWFPLESNPSVMQKYVLSLGLIPTFYKFTDVLCTEEWALEMVVPPVLALIFLYPIKPANEIFRQEEDARIKAHGQIVSPRLFFTKQTVGNACGTVGLLHALLNNKDKLEFREGSFLESFAERTQDKTPDERAVILEEDEGLDAAHGCAAADGQSQQVPMEEAINTHFVIFVEKDGYLYELDGRKNFPINHGKSSPETLLQDAMAVVRRVIAMDPQELKFTMVALSSAAGGQEEE